MIFISATTVSIMTVKPATPKATIVFTGYNEDDLKEKIFNNVKKGYVVKTVSIGGQYGNHNLVVMEKY